MEFKLQSGKPISLELVSLAMQILRESHCPQQAFVNSLPDFTSFDGYIIQLDNGDKYSYFLCCNPLAKS